MSIWPDHGKTRLQQPAHSHSAQEIAIFAAGLFAAMMVGIAARGLLPLI